MLRAPARDIASVRVFRHQTFMPGLDCLFEESLLYGRPVRDNNLCHLHTLGRAEEFFQTLSPRGLWNVHQIFAVIVQQVEEADDQWNLSGFLFDIVLATESHQYGLKRLFL